MAAWRRLGMLAVLGGYILAVFLRHEPGSEAGPVLPGSTGEMLWMLSLDLGLFATVWLVAVALGRPSLADLHLLHAPGPWRWFLGLLWSVGLRLGLGALLALVAVGLRFVRPGADPGALEGLQPRIGNLLPLEALKDPAYLLALCTVVSFVVAGLREELWRAGMIFALASLLPGAWGRKPRELVSVVLTAFVFGAGHVTQGPGGMVLTTALGLLLGLALVLRASLWEAVLAHGFFNATTFLMLRVLVDRALLEEWLARAGVPAESYRPLLEELGRRLGR